MVFENKTIDLKMKIESVLIPLFGDSIKSIIDSYYSENDPSELLELASHMLKGYFGDKKAENIMLDLNNFLKEQKKGGAALC